MLRCALLLGLMLAVGAARGAPLRVALAQTELRLYPTPEAYAAHMDLRMQAAMAHTPQLVLFPEDIGLPLVMIEDYEAIRQCRSPADVLKTMAARHAAAVAPLTARGISPPQAVLQVVGPRVRRLYRQTFGALAERYHVYVAAGSAPLPYRDGQVANVACLFAPDGTVVGRVGKTHLIPLEGPGGLDLQPVAQAEQRVWQTPLGNLGMIICADAWDPTIAAALQQGGARLLLNSLANPEPWSQATETGIYAGSLPARVAEVGLPGVQCFAVGDLFGLPFRGRSQVIRPLPGGTWEATARAMTADREEIVVGEVVL